MPRRIGDTIGTAAAVARNWRRVVVRMWVRASGEDGRVRPAGAVLRDVDRALLGDVGGVGRDAERVVDGGVQILDADRVLDGRARALVGRLPVDEALLHAAAEHQDRAGGREVAM